MAEARAKRHLAAILAADVVGYGRLMEADEAGTLAILKERRKNVLEPLVASHGGRIFKVTGDGMLAEFRSAVNAVQCAVDVQNGMAVANGDAPENRQIVLRIGVNLGDVIGEGSDLFGDSVNIAARLEALADPGGILISGTMTISVTKSGSASMISARNCSRTFLNRCAPTGSPVCERLRLRQPGRSPPSLRLR
jgi:adenylate cyclase